ncbi:hypothetical protein L9F63_007993, partial [Diploptera punctata]
MNIYDYCNGMLDKQSIFLKRIDNARLATKRSCRKNVRVATGYMGTVSSEMVLSESVCSVVEKFKNSMNSLEKVTIKQNVQEQININIE